MTARDANRVVCLSDTHLRRRGGLPAWCLQRLEGADLIIHAGDIVALSVYEELAQIAPVEAVAGNMDELALKSILPSCQIVQLEAVSIGVIHDPGPREGREARLADREVVNG